MDNYNLFMDGIYLPHPLTKDETYQLFLEYQNGSSSAREKLIIHNIRLVLYETIHTFKSVCYDKKELVAVGIIGLINAVDTYDVTRKVLFATYASRCICNAILAFLRNAKKDKFVYSFDTFLFFDKNGEGIKLQDRMSDDVNIILDYETKVDYEIIREVISDLPIRDREIIKIFFGFYGPEYTQEEIAQKYHLSQSYISRLIAKNLDKIKKELVRQGVVVDSKYSKKREK